VQGDVVHRILDEILHFLQQGIAAIFRFIGLVWDWSGDQISKLFTVPWQEWPVLKVILLLVIIIVVVWALYRVAWELWISAERILAAFATLLLVFVRTLPRILLAGVVALGGVWILNHVGNSMLEIPASIQVWRQPPPTTPTPTNPPAANPSASGPPPSNAAPTEPTPPSPSK
jgi:hypothetical protein